MAGQLIDGQQGSLVDGLVGDRDALAEIRHPEIDNDPAGEHLPGRDLVVLADVGGGVAVEP